METREKLYFEWFCKTAKLLWNLVGRMLTMEIYENRMRWNILFRERTKFIKSLNKELYVLPWKNIFLTPCLLQHWPPLSLLSLCWLSACCRVMRSDRSDDLIAVVSQCYQPQPSLNIQRTHKCLGKMWLERLTRWCCSLSAATSLRSVSTSCWRSGPLFLHAIIPTFTSVSGISTNSNLDSFPCRLFASKFAKPKQAVSAVFIQKFFQMKISQIMYCNIKCLDNIFLVETILQFYSFPKRYLEEVSCDIGHWDIHESLGYQGCSTFDQ